MLKAISFSVLLLLLSRSSTSELLDCKCGEKIGSSRIGDAIKFGKESTPNSSPWFATLISRSTGRFFCGGTLINDRYVLSAAHCFDRQIASNVQVVLGHHSLRTGFRSTHDGVTYGVRRAIVPRTYSRIRTPVALKDDVLLLELDRPVRFTDKISPACLPDASMNKYESFTALGFGQTAFTRSANRLQEADFTELALDKCSDAFFLTIAERDRFRFRGQSITQIVEYYKRRYGKFVNEDHICIIAPGRPQTAPGDSGGSLIYTKSGKSYVVGLTSGGMMIREYNHIGFMARVTSYLDWIKTNTRNANYCRD